MWPLKKKVPEQKVNSSDTIRSRIAQLISGSNYTGDTLHQIELDYGYPDALTFEMFWNMYRRFGIAKNVVELPVDIGWGDNPKVEGFGTDLDVLIDDLNLWQRLKGVDIRQRVGRYAGLFMRVRDNQKPDTELMPQSGVGALMDIIPLYEGQLEVDSIDSDPMSETYGLPVMYRFKGGGVGSRNTKNNDSFNIHPSRLVMCAEGSDNGGIHGIPALESCYNSLMDLRKIIGGGAEGFYKNAAQSVVFKLMDAASAMSNKELLDKFNEHWDDFSQNRARRGLWTPGLDPKTLDSNLSIPKEFFAVALNDVASASKIPATLLIGQQTGRLASDEDSRHFLSMLNSRRMNFQTELVRNVLDWCIKYRILKSVEYELEWSDLLAASNKEKLDNAAQMALVNKDQFSSGGSLPFTGEEIREAAGYEVEDMDIPDDAETDG